MSSEQLENWNKLTARKWVDLLTRQPELADKCDFSEFDGSNWTDLLLKRPQFASKCDWSRLKAWDLLKLLTAQPQFADKCDWNQIDIWDESANLSSMRSCRLFRRRSLLGKHKRPNYGAAWAALLSEQPQFAYKCDRSKLDGWNWASLLAKQPQFADKCDWNKLDSRDMVSLLVEQPQFATKCAWSKLDGWDWAYLLAEQPQFADKCDWNKLYIVYPDVVCNGIPEPYEEQQVFCWAKLLQAQPQFENRCDWRRLTGKDWALLLRDTPQYANKCNWNKLYEPATIKIEKEGEMPCDDEGCDCCVHSKVCKLGYYESPFSNWAVLLDKQPQFSGMCEWSRLNELDLTNKSLINRLFGHRCGSFHAAS